LSSKQEVVKRLQRTYWFRFERRRQLISQVIKEGVSKKRQAGLKKNL
jgi:hypothetical protein